MFTLADAVRSMYSMRKKAYVPLTPAAQQAVQGAGAPPPQGDPNAAPPMDPAMDPAMAQGGAPAPAMPQMPPEQTPPADPNAAAQGGQPAQGAPVVQPVPGPNGQPIDPETGLIVLDPQQGIEQDPLTGILFNKSLNEFATPDGQPLDPNQAIQMIMQAQQQAGGAQGGQMPPQGGIAPMPQDPAMTGGQPPMDPAMAQQAAPPMQQMAAEDPAMAGVPPQMPVDPAMMGGAPAVDPATMGVSMDPATGMPIDPATGMPVDPSTGAPIDPNTGAVAPEAAMPGEQAAQELFAAVPGLQEFVTKAPKQMEANDKTMARLQQDMNGTRTDIQGLRREIQKTNDNQNAMLGRMDNLLQIVEGIMSNNPLGKQDIVPQVTGSTANE